LATRTCINLVSRVLAHTFEFSVSRSRSPPHNLLPRVPPGRFAGLKHRQAPSGPPRRPTRRSPRAGFASLEDARLPRAGSAPFEGVRLPQAGSASLEGPLRPRTGSASLEGTPHEHACSCTRAFNALTSTGWRHHAPRARAPMPPHQLPGREPIPATVGGLCGVAGASPVTPRRLLRYG
jgi:hypothetical protein